MAESLDRWIAGSLDRWITGSLDRWIAGSVDRWIVRSLDCWIAGSMYPDQISSYWGVMVGGGSEDFTREMDCKTFLIFVYSGTCE